MQIYEYLVQRDMLEDVKNLILDILFPKYCLNCRKEGSYICDRCEIFLSDTSLICPICYKNSFDGAVHNACRIRYTLDGLISVWDYDGLIEKSIKVVKFGKRFDILNELVIKAVDIIENDNTNRFELLSSKFLKNHNNCISYVPMYKRKERERGFNQSKIIAEKLGQKFNLPVIELLKKIKDTKDQARLSKEKRIFNTRNSFVFNSDGLQNQSIDRIDSVVLIDDVFTTGTTMREASKVIKRYGSKTGIKNVLGFTIAKAI